MTGKYRHSIDGKGRLAVPARLREELGEQFYVAIGLSKTLMILTREGWHEIEEKKKSLPLSEAQKLRFFFANAVHCEPDKQGRILIPAELRAYAELKENVVILGFGDKSEIWDAERYDALERSFLEDGAMDEVFLALQI